jgi:hypothetical protein
MYPMGHVPSRKVARTAAVALMSAALASCAGVPQPRPEEVRSTKPGVTYSYRTDAELVEATRKADDYCQKYGSWPRASNIVSNPDGGKTVAYDCDPLPRPVAAVAVNPVTVAAVPATTVAVPVSPVAVAVSPVAVPVTPIKPSVSYTYRGDRDLVEATQNAERYCLGFSARPRAGAVIGNADGSRTMRFDCEP